MGLEGIGGERRGQARSCRRGQGQSLDARVNTWALLVLAGWSSGEQEPQMASKGPHVGPVVKTPPASAGVTGSIPGAERSHLPQSHQVPEPRLLKPVLHRKRSHCREKSVNRKEEQPPLIPTRESRHTATKTRPSQT